MEVSLRLWPIRPWWFHTFNPCAELLGDGHEGMWARFKSQASIALNWHSRYSGTHYTGTWLHFRMTKSMLSLLMPWLLAWPSHHNCGACIDCRMNWSRRPRRRMSATCCQCICRNSSKQGLGVIHVHPAFIQASGSPWPGLVVHAVAWNLSCLFLWETFATLLILCVEKPSGSQVEDSIFWQLIFNSNVLQWLGLEWLNISFSWLADMFYDESLYNSGKGWINNRPSSLRTS